MTAPNAFLSLLLLAAIPSAPGSDWPQFLGPTRNGISADVDISASWPKDSPKVLWKTKLGRGWSGPVVASNRVVIFHRLDDRETVECLNVTNGSRLWSSHYATTYRDDFGFDDGPRATPAIDGNRLFTFGANGILNCWDFVSGTNLWRVDTHEHFKTEKGFFGVACSPLVEANLVILNMGGSGGAGIVAFDKVTGKVLWKATDERASYSSPVAATINDRRYVFVFARKDLVALEPGNGKVFWTFPWRPRIQASVSAAVPLIINDEIFISASYDTGAALLRFNETKPVVIWSGDDILSNHYATSVHHNGFLYGFDGRQEERCRLRCVELKTGKVRWSEDGLGAGTLILASDKLLILHERGELIAAKASADKFTLLSRAQIIGSDVRAHPALANGLFYARDKTSLVCIDLRK